MTTSQATGSQHGRVDSALLVALLAVVGALAVITSRAPSGAPPRPAASEGPTDSSGEPAEPALVAVEDESVDSDEDGGPPPGEDSPGLAPTAAVPPAQFVSGFAGYRYLVRLPPTYAQTNRPWPLIIMLHGGVPGIDFEGLKRYGPMHYASRHPEFPFVVASPLTHRGWSPALLSVFAEGLRASVPRIDCNRVYLTGESMGGHATWAWAITQPQRFAAIAPVCAAGNPELARVQLRQMPVWIFHGENDRVVPVQCGQVMHETLAAIGAPVRATFYPDRDHDSWTPAYDNPELYEWFLRHTRPTADGVVSLKR